MINFFSIQKLINLDLKLLCLVCFVICAASCSSDLDSFPESSENLFQNAGTIYFENGTCKCPNAQSGDKELINNTVYTAVDDASIRIELKSGNVNLCTTLVTDMSGTLNPQSNFFNNNSFNSNIEFWDVSNVINMDGMFYNADTYNQPLDLWDTSKVENMGSMFKNAVSFNQDISEWDTSKVTKMLEFFKGATSFNQNIGEWNVSNVINMDAMFYDAISFNQDLSSWCVASISESPENFSLNSQLNESNLPQWGSCSE